MSRGLGAIQRTALRILRESGHWHTTSDLAAGIYGHRPHITVTAMPTRSQMVATQRALSGLARAGLAYRVSGRPTRWTANRDRHLSGPIAVQTLSAIRADTSGDVFRARRRCSLLRGASKSANQPTLTRQAERRRGACALIRARRSRAEPAN